MDINKKFKNIFDKIKIKDRKRLQVSFGIICEKIILENDDKYIAKYYQTKKNQFNSIDVESNSLLFLNDLNFELFPKVYYFVKEILIMDLIDHDGIKPKNLKVGGELNFPPPPTQLGLMGGPRYFISLQIMIPNYNRNMT